MDFSVTHAFIDRVNAEQDRLIAQKLRRGDKPLKIAQENLKRWMRKDGRKPRPVFIEWHNILERLTRREIADFLVSETPMARRLRQSSPFPGVLSAGELERIRRRHAKG